MYVGIYGDPAIVPILSSRLVIGLLIQNFIEGIQHECVVYSCGRGR
jgi:hypothetical protein